MDPCDHSPEPAWMLACGAETQSTKSTLRYDSSATGSKASTDGAAALPSTTVTLVHTSHDPVAAKVVGVAEIATPSNTIWRWRGEKKEGKHINKCW